ncbi:reverse transcriptase domain-containing protein [Bradyrhizobium sp. S3.5.5]|uniref:reverse transcriptase domain-containing protein n=1 Tax=Bradyrhizobium sp. S3.5.5 TaxID=3156430 RepID=UPI003394DC04
MRNVARSFTKDGKRFFVPTNSYWAWRLSSEGLAAHVAGRESWLQLKQQILKRWAPHPSNATFASGAHVAALRPHESHTWFAVIDLQNFYDHVTSTKIHRALEKIGFPRAFAFKLAGQSTIRQGQKYVLPRGFRQSPLLAALVLEQSLFGSYLRRQFYRSTITLFSDDIIISSNDKDELEDEFQHVTRSLAKSNFPVNPLKTQAPRREIVAFNMRMSQDELRFTDERMWKFVTKAAHVTEGDPYLYDKLFGDYVFSINEVQEGQLRASVGVK